MVNRYLLELFIALRYLRGHGRTVIFSLGTRLSFLFMGLMVFIMVVVLSVFNGFQKEIHNSLWNSGYHITISRYQNNAPIQGYEAIVNRIRNDPEIKPNIRSVFGSITVNALIDVNNQFEGKGVRALPVDGGDLETGNLKDFPRIVHFNRRYLSRINGGNYAIIGRELARYYNWQVGDRIKLYMPQGGSLRRNMQVRVEEFVIAGFFRTGYLEFDQNLIFISLKTAQRILGLGDTSTEIIVQLNDLAYLETVTDRIRDLYPYKYSIRTIKDEKGNFLAALQLEKTSMIIILGLLIVAGIAGIWVTVHLLVRAKSRSIGMLRAMGLPAGSIIVIFTAHSMLIGLLSTLVGGSIGIFVANRLETIIQIIEDLINAVCGWTFGRCAPVSLIPKNIYYFDHLPVSADLSVIFGIAVTTMILSGLAGYFPSRESALMDPVKTIRND